MQSNKYKNLGTKRNDDRSHEISTSKGKGPDPENWGNVQLTREEMNPESQRALLDSYKPAQKKHNKRSNKEKKRSALKQDNIVKGSYSTDKSAMKHSDSLGRAMRPIEQVEPNSYIGLALKRLKSGYGLSEDENESSESDESSNRSSFDEYESSDDTTSSNTSIMSESSESSSSESSDESLTSSSSMMSYSRKRQGQMYSGKTEKSSNKKNKTKRKSKRKKHHGMKLKPIPPTGYDGMVNPQMFHRFITEGTAYVHDG